MPTTLDLPTPPVLPRGIDLPTEDDQNLETGWHRDAINFLIASVEQHLRGRTDFCVGGNQFFYFDPAEARNVHFRGPDFYFVNGVPHEPLRRSWVVWEEGGRVPNVIVEFLSESTAEDDRGEKKQVYLEQLDVKEYYCYDPDTRRLEGWRKGKRKPVAIKPQGGRLWSEELDLFLGRWDGEFQGHRDTWLRLFGGNGELILIANETAERRAEAEAARAEVEREAKDAALAELATLRAELARLKNTPTA